MELTTELETKLKEIFPNESVTRPDAPLFRNLIPESWECRPELLVSPGSSDEISRLMHLANQLNFAILPCGGGTQLHTGNPLASDRPVVLLSLSRMNRILDYQPEDMTITCEPGATLEEIQTKLASRRQFLALDAPLPETATMGGIVSTNLSGFLRPSFGTPRDLLIGVRAVTSKGEQIRGGGKVVKNVAGYDICKLFTGAWGTIGVLTELTFRVRPLPDTSRTIAWRMASVSEASRIGLLMHHAQLAPIAILSTNEIESQPHLIVELQGTKERVDWQADEFSRRIGEATESLKRFELSQIERDGLLTLQARKSPSVRAAAKISCLPSDVPGILAKLETTPGILLTALAGTGSVSLGMSECDLLRMKAVADALPKEANLVWTKLERELAKSSGIDVWGAKRGEFLIHQSLKQALDPDRRFSPGRFYGGL